MGFAKDKINSDVRAQIAASLFVVKTDDSKRSELIGLCPIHGESNPSFSYNVVKDVYFCQSCQATGDLIDLWCHVNGQPDKKEGFKAFCRAHQIEKDGSSSRPAAAAKRQEKKAEKIVPIIDESVWERMQPLPEAFRKKLIKERSWSDDVFEKLDIRLQTVYLDKDGKTIREVSRAERIAIPIRNTNGELVNIRLYRPGAKVGKIMSWGKGYGAAQLFPAAPVQDGSPIVICEGEPDTICAIAHGINAITQTSKLVNWPDHQTEQFKGRNVVVAYDADQPGDDYAWKAAKSLSGSANAIKLLIWPEKMGCVYGYWPLKHGEDLTDFFAKHGGTVEKFNALKTRIHAKPESQKKEESAQKKNEVQPPLGGEEFFHMNNQGRWTFKPRWLADRICEDLQLLFEPLTSRMYQYSGTYWEDFQEEHLEATAIRYLGDESTSSRAADSAKQAKLLSILPHGRETNDSGMMCLENGMLDISDIKNGEVDLKPHEKEYYATYQLPISFYDSDEKKCTRWLQFLAETIKTPEVIMQAQEFAGYCLTRETRYAKSLLLLGPGSDGKSTFISVIEQLVGERNSTSLSMSDLEDQFYRSGLYNKMLCTSTEISKDYFNSAYFKAIVTGDTISAAHKNKDPFEFKPFCKMIFAGNDMPRSRDNSDGYFRRLLPIRFKRQFFGGEDDKHLAETLTEELPMILNWALAGLIRLLQQDSFTRCEETDEMLHQYRRDNNPVMAFIEAKCTLGESQEVDKDGLYRKYRDFCEQYNYRALNRVHFFKELLIAQKTLESYRPIIEGKRVRMIKGLSLNMDDSA